jgi:hypothetical protein
MYYWNKGNFQGLKDIGEEYSLKSGYKDFACFCLLKEKGMKKEAIKAINNFISSVQLRSLKEQREIAEELTILKYCNEDIHQLIPHPLERYLLSVFKCWAEEDNESSVPHRWLGYISKDLTNFERALEKDPNDEISIINLAQANISYVHYQTHHLSESLFIGTINDAMLSLQRVNDLLKKLGPGQQKDSILEDYQYFVRLLNIWQIYKQGDHKVSFPEWCQLNGEEVRFWKAFYYN